MELSASRVVRKKKMDGDAIAIGEIGYLYTYVLTISGLAPPD